MSAESQSPQAALRPIQMVSAMVGIGSVMITVMRIFVDTAAPLPSLAAIAIVLVALIAAAVLIRLVGYSVPPLPRGVTPEHALAASLRHYTSTTTLRTAIAETPVLVAFAVSFAFQPHTWLPLLIALPGALALWWLHAWPSRRTAAALERVLEADGTPSHLSETLGFR